MSLTAGAKLGPYEIQSPLGAGGMGEVYRATQSSLGRQVAIKVLAFACASDPERLRRFDGRRVVVSYSQPSRSLVMADGVPDVIPASR